MQAVYEHTVTAELTQAADRARVLIHPASTVYLLTNEPCPRSVQETPVSWAVRGGTGSGPVDRPAPGPQRSLPVSSRVGRFQKSCNRSNGKPFRRGRRECRAGAGEATGRAGKGGPPPARHVLGMEGFPARQ